MPTPQVIETEIGYALAVPIPYFLDRVLPPLHPHICLETVLTRLKLAGKKSRRVITREGRWWGFSQDPEDAKRSNKTSFLHFPKIVDAIEKCGAPNNMKATLHAIHNPVPIYFASDRDDDTRPDAYMVIRGGNANDVQWADIGVVGEYQKLGSDTTNNFSKLCWSIEHAFTDPRRRFVYGYTVENTNFRMWYCDRSQVVVSDACNFITDHKTVTHFFLSLLFASRERLGWDPSIQVSKADGNGLNYDFTVHSADGSTSIFRSLELISDGHPKAVIEGKTRVWKVIPIVDGDPVGQPVVLKDCWIYDEVEREGDTLRKIQLSNDSEEFQRSFSAHFLTVVSHGEVFIHAADDAPHGDRTIDHRTQLKAYMSDKSLAHAHRAPSRHRVHYRIVFKEICTPLKLSAPLSFTFSALEDICNALELLHHAGWVHRDISVGNIMLDEAGHARLADLEYAKEFGDENRPEIAVGTAPFMSAEVIAQAYHCVLPATPPKKTSASSDHTPSGPHSDDLRRLIQECNEGCSDHSSDDSSVDDVIKLALAIRRQKVKHPEDIPSPGHVPSPGSSSSDTPHSSILGAFTNDFRYNPLHDLESVFWIAVYFLFKSIGKDMDAQEIERQQAVAKKLLYEETQHCRAIRLDGVFLENLDAVHPLIRQIGVLLDSWRFDLTNAFYAAEKYVADITSSVGQGLHARLAKTFREMTALVQELSIEPPQLLAARLLKRVEEDDEVDGDQDSVDPSTRHRDKRRKLSLSRDIRK